MEELRRENDGLVATRSELLASLAGQQGEAKAAARLAEASKASSFFEVADGPPEDAPKLESRKVKAMKPTQLKEELKLRGLSTQGNAKELQKRLIDAAC